MKPQIFKFQKFSTATENNGPNVSDSKRARLRIKKIMKRGTRHSTMTTNPKLRVASFICLTIRKSATLSSTLFLSHHKTLATTASSSSTTTMGLFRSKKNISKLSQRRMVRTKHASSPLFDPLADDDSHIYGHLEPEVLITPKKKGSKEKEPRVLLASSESPLIIKLTSRFRYQVSSTNKTYLKARVNDMQRSHDDLSVECAQKEEDYRKLKIAYKQLERQLQNEHTKNMTLMNQLSGERVHRVQLTTALNNAEAQLRQQRGCNHRKHPASQHPR